MPSNLEDLLANVLNCKWQAACSHKAHELLPASACNHGLCSLLAHLHDFASMVSHHVHA